MNILLKNVEVVDPTSSWNGKKMTLGVVSGKLTANTKGVAFAKEFDVKGASVCPGFFDMRAFMGEPGLEYKEDFDTFQQAASMGGFTDVAVLPNTVPVVETKDVVKSIRQRAQGQRVTLHPYAALSKGAKGEEITEMIDLHKAGAVGFTDGHEVLKQADLLLKGLQYSQYVGATLITVPMDYSFSRKGLMNEGVVSTRLGLPGIPHLAEVVAIERDLRVLEYGGGKLHFSLVTTAEGVDLIRKAKKKGLAVTCDVAAHYLAYDDSIMVDFDTNTKVFPPFRLKEDVKALQKGLKDGTIDAIVSDHRPQNIEQKKLEFDQASYGIASIETTFSWAVMHAKLERSELVQCLSHAPRKILGLPVCTLEEGAPARLTIVHFEQPHTVSIHSKSKNNPAQQSTLQGAVLGLINGTKVALHEN